MRCLWQSFAALFLTANSLCANPITLSEAIGILETDFPSVSVVFDRNCLAPYCNILITHAENTDIVYAQGLVVGGLWAETATETLEQDVQIYDLASICTESLRRSERTIALHLHAGTTVTIVRSQTIPIAPGACESSIGDGEGFGVVGFETLKDETHIYISETW